MPERNVSRIAERICLALWLGGGVFLAAIAAPAAFRYAGAPSEAASIVGAMLAKWHYLALIAPGFALVRRLRGSPSLLITVILSLSILMASGQIAADMAIAKIRRESPRPISLLSKADPVRQRFGMLHGLSSILLLLQIACAAVAISRDESPAGPAS